MHIPLIERKIFRRQTDRFQGERERDMTVYSRYRDRDSGDNVSMSKPYSYQRYMRVILISASSTHYLAEPPSRARRQSSLLCYPIGLRLPHIYPALRAYA